MMSTNTLRKKSARCLFGSPDPKILDAQLQNDLDKIYENDRKKWNFDFKFGIPINDGAGDYTFTPVTADEVPNFYREKSLKSRKTSKPTLKKIFEIGDHEISPVSSDLMAQSSSNDMYQKPVTRSATRQKCAEEKELKQTKLTNFMPVRKRRSETSLVSISRSTSFDFLGDGLVGEKKIIPNTIRFNTTNNPILNNVSSVSDTTLVTSPRSPPAKRSNRRRRQTGAGDFIV